MSNKRKSWEPEYRFGGNRADGYLPNRLGSDTRAGLIKVAKPKKAKRK